MIKPIQSMRRFQSKVAKKFKTVLFNQYMYYILLNLAKICLARYTDQKNNRLCDKLFITFKVLKNLVAINGEGSINNIS